MTTSKVRLAILLADLERHVPGYAAQLAKSLAAAEHQGGGKTNWISARAEIDWAHLPESARSKAPKR